MDVLTGLLQATSLSSPRMGERLTTTISARKNRPKFVDRQVHDMRDNWITGSGLRRSVARRHKGDRCSEQQLHEQRHAGNENHQKS